MRVVAASDHVPEVLVLGVDDLVGCFSGQGVLARAAELLA